MNSFIEKYKAYFLPGLLGLFFLTEAWSTIKIEVWEIKSFLPKAFKFLTIIFISIYLLIKERKLFLLVLILGVCFIVGQLFLPNPFELSVITSFSKYLFFLLIGAFFIKSYTEKTSKLVFSVFEGIIIVNSLIIFLSFIFEWRMFSSYKNRFGYDGLFIASATGTYFYCISLAYLFLKYRINVFKKAVFYFVLVSVFLLGTKTAFLYLIFSVTLLFLSEIKNLKTKLIVGATFILTGCFGLYFFLQRGIFKEITANEGWVTSVLSYRDQLIINKTLPYIEENWTLVNYFFGGASVLSYRPQMEYFDLLLFFGFMGSSFYLYLLYKFYSFKKIQYNSLAFYLLFLLFAAAFISGNFFYNGSTPIYFAVLVLLAVNSKTPL